MLEAARTGSLFAPRRAVVVRGADALKGEDDAVVDLPRRTRAPGVVLVLMAAKPDKRRSGLEAAAGARAVDFRGAA